MALATEPSPPTTTTTTTTSNLESWTHSNSHHQIECPLHTTDKMYTDVIMDGFVDLQCDCPQSFHLICLAMINSSLGTSAGFRVRDWENKSHSPPPLGSLKSCHRIGWPRKKKIELVAYYQNCYAGRLQLELHRESRPASKKVGPREMSEG